MPDIDLAKMSNFPSELAAPIFNMVPFSGLGGAVTRIPSRSPGFCRARWLQPAYGRARFARNLLIAALHCQLQLAVLERMTVDPARPGRWCGDRAAFAHARTISIYVCHVTLRMTMTEIAGAIGRHRSTIGYTCARVEDRRDDPRYDALVNRIEILAPGVFSRLEGCGHEG